MRKRVFLTALLSLVVIAAGCVVAPYPAEVVVAGPPVIYGAPGVVLEIGSPIYVVEYDRRYGCCFHAHYYQQGGNWHRGPRR